MILYLADIVEGNVKSVMRLILALAAHFKPGSVKPKQEPTVEADVQNRVTRRPSAAAAAAEAAAAIGEASRAAANVGRHLGAHYRNRTGIKYVVTCISGLTTLTNMFANVTNIVGLMTKTFMAVTKYCD